MPLVSVIVPCYNNNNERYLRDCFDSIINQTYSPIQLIVIDDGSTDGTSALLEKLQIEYDFILEKQKNKGISGALNTGIKKYAKGKYIAMMGSDDYWALNKLAVQVTYMESAGSNVAASCTWGYWIYENIPSRPTPRLTRQLKPSDLSFEGLLKSNSIMQISVMIRKEIMDQIGLFDENSAVEDWDMWLRIAHDYVFGYIPEPLVYYRRHSFNLSNYFDKLYDSHVYIVGKWKGEKGQQQSMNQVQINGINYFSRHKKIKALKIALTNIQCANSILYWRGVFKVLLPSFLYPRK